MRILDDGPDGAGAHEFAVQLEIDDGSGAQRRLWESAPDKGEYGGHVAVEGPGRAIADGRAPRRQRRDQQRLYRQPESLMERLHS